MSKINNVVQKSNSKIYSDINVYVAAKKRIQLIMKHFSRICVAFSGGKDSSVLLHLVLEVAKEEKFGLIDAVFIDLEGQYQATIDHVNTMFSHPDIRPWWICLPLNLRNASSLSEPYWCAWEPGRESEWVRPMPTHWSVINDKSFFPFYRYRMEFEEFIPAFNEWISTDENTAILVGIRSDESLNRYLAIKRKAQVKKSAWKAPDSKFPIQWSSKDYRVSNAVTFFPIYDWQFKDLWRYIAEHNHPYNQIYDYMYQLGIPFSQMRICQPYGDDQRKGLDLFHKLEPKTWFRVVQRVEGANYAARYCRQQFLGYRGSMGLPSNFNTWKDYSLFLLESMPLAVRIIYQRRINRFIQWWEAHNYPLEIWPDVGIPALENKKAQPSWRRIALSLLKQDMARSLSFGFAKQDKDLLISNQQEK